MTQPANMTDPRAHLDDERLRKLCDKLGHDVDLRTEDERTGQQSLWATSCESGHCGV